MRPMWKYAPKWLKKFKTCSHFLFTFRNLTREQLDSIRSLHRRNWEEPSPRIVKDFVLAKWGGRGVWIETGTYYGETTEMLARIAQKVYSIEPSFELVELAKKKFMSVDSVSILPGTSEQVLGNLLSQIIKNETLDISFWLDGHYSEGNTFLGENETPIVQELDAISGFIPRFSEITILVDDVRCFRPQIPRWRSYPDLNYLVSWANEQGLFWTIEHDIFIMTNRNLESS